MGAPALLLKGGVGGAPGREEPGKRQKTRKMKLEGVSVPLTGSSDCRLQRSKVPHGD